MATIKYVVELDLAVKTDDVAVATAFLERFREQLAELTDNHNLDPDGEPEFTCAVHVSADTPLDAVLAGTTLIRAAAHAAEASTKHWPDVDEWPEYIREKAVRARELDEQTEADHLGKELAPA